MKGLSTYLSYDHLPTYLLLLVHLLTVNCSPAPAPLARSEDAWLAVINGGTAPQARPDPLQVRQDTEQYQFEQTGGLGEHHPVERVAEQALDVQQVYDRVPQQQNRREHIQTVERLAQQPPLQQQLQPQLPPRVVQQQSAQPQTPVGREPVRQFQRQPQRSRKPVQPPRLGHAPRPGQVQRPGQVPRPGFGKNRKKKPTGIIGHIGSAVHGVVEHATCATANLITDEKMKDEKFIRFQLDCALGRGPCDVIGNKIKILAPEVLAGRCPPPCDECTQKQIRRVMTELSQRFPREFQEMMIKIRG